MTGRPFPVPCDGNLYPDATELARLLANAIERKALDEARWWSSRLNRVLEAMAKMEAQR